MRLFPWLLVASSLLLSTALVAQQNATPTAVPSPGVASKRTAANPRASAKRPATQTAVASVRQIMAAMVVPSSEVVFGSVEVILTIGGGVQEKQPRTDAEWTNVVNNAVVLTEAGNLLMIAGRFREKAGPIRARDRADWMMRSKELVDAGTVALKAANARDVEALADAGERIDEACDECHERYLEGDPTPGSAGHQKPRIVVRPSAQTGQ